MITKKIKRLCLNLAIGIAILSAGAIGQAQTLTTSWTNNFNDATGAGTGSWCWWYDMYQQAYGFNYNGLITNSFDSVKNSTMGPPPTSGSGSGSLAYWSLWPGVPQNTGKGGQTLIYGTFGGGNQFDTSKTIDATKYDSLSFDLYVDPSSPLNQNGNVCSLTVGFFLNNYNTYTITNAVIGTNNFGTWVRYVCPINKSTAPTPPGALPAGPMFNINCYGGENTSLFTNTVPTKMWIDNIYLKLSTVVSPPPRLSSVLTDPKPGLNLFSSGPSTDNFQRSNIKLADTTGASWLGQQGVTYSMTITNFPDANLYPGYQAHIFVTTGPGNNPAMDYNDANLIWLNVGANADGTGTAYFRYKINEPGANTNMFGAEYIGTASAGTLTNLPASSVLGTWSMTFNNDTNVTLNGPGGATVTFSMRPEAAAPFVDPLSVAFGAQPNNATNVGQEVVLSSILITNAGGGGLIASDNFMADSFLDTSKWSILTGEPNTVSVFPLDPGQKLVSWSTPDAGFGLQVSTNVALSSSWVTVTGPEATGTPLTSYSLSGTRFTLVPSADLGPTQNYFRLFTRSFKKLQVLMPGETAAPGTPTGKTGTPDPQTSNVPFIVTVNAVDANWYPATYNTDHTIHIATTDGTATLPPDGVLVGGTANLSVTFNTSGVFTVTASDVTDASKTANTGTATTNN